MQRRKTKFFDMCDALGDMGVWVRLHYVYPYPHVDDVIPMMAEGKILPYLDIPFPACQPKNFKGDEASGQSGKNRAAYSEMA